MFDALGRLESLGYRSLSELASLHGSSLHSTPGQDDARDIIVNHFLSGECTKTNYCDTVSFILNIDDSFSRVHLFNDPPMLILDGTLRTVTKNPCFPS